ncbi:hypothetical protein ACP70R_043879 [Stipagrostis hirtigluma subsp. patula]
MEGSFQLNPDASPFVPASLSLFADKSTEKQAESSSKRDLSGSILGPSQYEENDMDPLALANSVFSMFPNVSAEFIDELLKANEFDINLTIDMLHELNSQDMLREDAELGSSTFPDGRELHDVQGLPGGDNHCPEASESSSSTNQALQNENSATLAKTDSPHNDLGQPADDNKSEGASAAN